GRRDRKAGRRAEVLRYPGFRWRRRKTLAPQGPRQLPKLDVAGSTPVARSRRKPLCDQGLPVASIYDSHPARTALALREKAGRRPRVQREPAARRRLAAGAIRSNPPV